MSRKRLIDTDALYFDTDIVSLMDPKGLHLYIGLWGMAEDWGGYEPKYADIALRMGALCFTPTEVKGYLDKLLTANKVIEYVNGGGIKYHWIVKFLKHQRLDNPTPPTLPLPSWISCEIKEYLSGKKYACYNIIKESLPEVLQHTSGILPVEGKQKQKQNRNGNETERKLYTDVVRSVLDHLNSKTGKNYRITSKDNFYLVVYRLKEGYTAEDLKKVVDNMTDKWMGDEKMEQYLRPSTLFRRSHVEGYLNADKGLSSSMKNWGKK